MVDIVCVRTYKAFNQCCSLLAPNVQFLTMHVIKIQVVGVRMLFLYVSVVLMFQRFKYIHVSLVSLDNYYYHAKEPGYLYKFFESGFN